MRQQQKKEHDDADDDDDSIDKRRTMCNNKRSTHFDLTIYHRQTVEKLKTRKVFFDVNSLCRFFSNEEEEENFHRK